MPPCKAQRAFGAKLAGEASNHAHKNAREILHLAARFRMTNGRARFIANPEATAERHVEVAGCEY
jgi:hypothetical protein